MATAEKLSVSIHKDDLAWARTYAKESGRSLSAVLTEALREQRRTKAMAHLLKRLGAHKLTQAQIDAADAELFGR